MNGKISASLMCVDFFDLGGQIEVMKREGIDLLHIDMMDGQFVQNYTLGTDLVRALKKRGDIPLDIHLMIEDPEKKLDWFEFGEGDYVSVHFEATKHLHRALSMIKARGAKALVAINPATPISALDSLLYDIDGVLVMTVNPGFAGQSLVKSTLDKIRRLRAYLDSEGRSDIEIEVDGNVSFANAPLMREAGADIFVAGTSSVFSKDDTIKNNITKLRQAIK